MSIPPANRQPSNPPPSRGRRLDDRDEKDRKEFKLPDRKQEVGEEDKKKKLFDLAGKEISMQEKQQNLSQDVKVEATKEVTGVAAANAAAQVKQVSQLVLKMVETMHIGQIDGKTFASLDLKTGTDVPQAFAGSQLTLTYQENGLKIHFDNFMSPQQQNEAIVLAEKNKEQLQEMIQALNAKNIQVAELSLGTHIIALPRVTPLQVTSLEQTETQQQQGERDTGDQEGGDEGSPR